jgi:hypothetical protein
MTEPFTGKIMLVEAAYTADAANMRGRATLEVDQHRRRSSPEEGVRRLILSVYVYPSVRWLGFAWGKLDTVEDWHECPLHLGFFSCSSIAGRIIAYLAQCCREPNTTHNLALSAFLNIQP